MPDRRTLARVARPAAWHAAVAEQAWRLRRTPSPQSARIADATVVYWPTEYQHPNAATFVEPLRTGLERLCTVEHRPIAQAHPGIVSIHVQTRAGTFPVAIDYYDYTFVNQACLDDSALYFKLQFERSGYDDRRVVPGGYVAGKGSLYRHYRRLRELGKRPPTHDVYARFGTRFGGEARRRAIALLEQDDRFGFVGGTTPVLYMQSLREAARARVCVDMPGNGPLCYRLVEYLAIGCCVVAPRHEAVLNAELRDGEHIVECSDDLSDLAELCALYAQDDAARATIGANAARFFDEHLHPVQLARHYLSRCDELG